MKQLDLFEIKERKTVLILNSKSKTITTRALLICKSNWYGISGQILKKFQLILAVNFRKYIENQMFREQTNHPFYPNFAKISQELRDKTPDDNWDRQTDN